MLILPIPPSTNNLYANYNGRRKTARYKEWITAAGWEIKRQKPVPIKGWLILDITVERKGNRKQDVSNRIKACEDLLVTHGVIEDDSKVWEVRARWGDVEGCEVWYRPINDARK